jgi:dihydrofolate reductase
MVSLDGVMQAPGGPQEDPTGGFAFGGWSFSYWDDDSSRDMRGLDGKDREIVLGRRTYEIFEAYWPYQPADSPIAQTLNAARKHVASRTLKALRWNNSTLLRGDVVAAVAALKSQAGLDLQIIGSANLIQTLRSAALIDEYNVWTFPVVLGRGKRLFEAGARAGALRLGAARIVRAVRAERPGDGAACETGPRSRLTHRSTAAVATVLDKELKRQITVDGVDYTVVVDPDGLRLVGKGKRKPEVELRWRDLLSGDAAMSVALNASLADKRQPAARPTSAPPPHAANVRAAKKSKR